MTGAEVARLILDQNGLQNVKVVESQGFLSDHYNPVTKIVALSSHNYHEASVAGTAIAAHEVGHAIQDKEAYSFLRFRHRLGTCCKYHFQCFLDFYHDWDYFFKYELIAWNRDCIACCRCRIPTCYIASEFNASTRAMNQIVDLGIIRNEEEATCEKSIECSSYDICCSSSSSCS